MGLTAIAFWKGSAILSGFPCILANEDYPAVKRGKPLTNKKLPYSLVKAALAVSFLKEGLEIAKPILTIAIAQFN
ncbi:MAG: hypothetical protein ICV62_05335 [Cyanobacteria bacterium Co-bin13]|nr:hypothetical protein [Cyanobacteria bacterium Co-bin13]